LRFASTADRNVYDHFRALADVADHVQLATQVPDPLPHAGEAEVTLL
jgi:hypothetical protein